MFKKGDLVRLKPSSQFFAYHLGKKFFYVREETERRWYIVDDVEQSLGGHMIARRAFRIDDIELVSKNNRPNHPNTTIFQ